MPVKLGISLELSLHLQFRPVDWHRCGCTLAGAWACEELGSCGLYHCWLSCQSHFGVKFLEEWSIENFEALGISLNWCRFLPWSIEWLTVVGIHGRILLMQETTQRHVYWFKKCGFPSFWNISWSLGPLRGWQGWMISLELFHCQVTHVPWSWSDLVDHIEYGTTFTYQLGWPIGLKLPFFILPKEIPFLSRSCNLKKMPNFFFYPIHFVHGRGKKKVGKKIKS
jgi:hypothetical protein